MLYMIIEHFRAGKAKEIYKRAEEKGRQLPEGLIYVNSWVDDQLSTCYQVMETDTESKIREWISCWSDLVDFEIIPVITSAEARERVLSA